MDKKSQYTQNNITLFYIHDPMCSWCWAFHPVWQQIYGTLKEPLKIKYLLGGLAPDTNEPMPLELQVQIQGYWRTIQQRVPGTQFNYDFWKNNQPRRATYPACRAVIAARHQNAETEMILAIQQAYYLRALNPSDDNILVQLADGLSLDTNRFSKDLNDPTTHKQLMNEISQGQQIGAMGFPSLILQYQDKNHPIRIDYNNPTPILDEIMQIIS